MRVLLRILLTLVVALPVVLGMVVFLAADALASERPRLGQERTP